MNKFSSHLDYTHPNRKSLQLSTIEYITNFLTLILRFD